MSSPERGSQHNTVSPLRFALEHLLRALVIGLGIGTLLGLIESLSVLWMQKLVGQYNELVPWAVLFDAGALAAWELATAFVIVVLLLIVRRRPSPALLTSVQLGLGVFAVTVGLEVWLATLNPNLTLAQALSSGVAALGWGALIGCVCALASAWITRRRTRPRLARTRYAFVFVALLWAGAVLFGLDLYKPGTVPVLSMSTSSAAPRYNVLIVTIDTLRGDSIGLDGNPVVKTPTLDQVGHDGTWFTTAIVQQPNTNASHTSIFTGVLPFVHGVRQHMIDRLTPGIQTLAEVLSRNGYQTAGLYSWVSLEPGFSGLRGFQTYQDLSIHLTTTLQDPRFQNLIVTYRLLGKYLLLPQVIENQFLQGTQNAVEDTTDGKANVTTDAALRWLGANSNKPFFLWVHYYDPHYPYTPPPPFDTAYDPDYRGTVDGGMGTIHYIFDHNTGELTDADVRHLQALYDGEISFADQQLGRLMDEVDRLNLRENTLVIITGDHGESLGTEGRWFHGSRLNYTDIHVPLIMRFPPAIPVNRQIDTPVESIDIMPTVLDLLQVPAPAEVQGKSLMPLMRGAQADPMPPAITMMDTFNQISIVTTRWHLIWDRTQNVQHMYDYHADPLELNNEAYDRPDVTTELMQELNQRLNDLGFDGR